ncbi:MAG: DUF4292 domain-containing protein [Bacteroidota bacterium]
MFPIKTVKYFIYLIAVISLTGCNITKEIGRDKTVTVITPEEIDHHISQNTLLSRGIVINGARIKIKNEEQTNRIRANFKIKPDSAMLISLSNSLGIEFVRALITPDSIRFVNRINRNYIAGKYSVVASMYHIPVEYKDLQDALVGVNSMFLRSMHYPRKSYKSDSGFYMLNKTASNVTLQYKVDNAQYFIRQVNFNFNNFPTKISIDYSNYTKFDDVYIPMDISSIIYEKDQNIQVNIDFSDIRLEPVEITLKVPESYQKIYP